MKANERHTARRALDKRLGPLLNSVALARPKRGWIRAIREALGMTNKQVGQRLGVTAPRVVAIQKSEASGAITMASLQRVAHALDCELVYALVPRVSLERQVQERALRIAQQQLATTQHTMALEDQGVSTEDEDRQLASLTRKLMEESGSKLWEMV